MPRRFANETTLPSRSSHRCPYTTQVWAQPLEPAIVAPSLCEEGTFSHALHGKKATILFQKLSQQLQQVPALQARFKQHKKIKVLRFPLISEGKLLYSRKKGMTWKQTLPFPSTFVISSQGIWQRAKGGKMQSMTVKARPSLREFIHVFLAMFYF